MMKRQYEEPEIEIEWFPGQDVITFSGGNNPYDPGDPNDPIEFGDD